MSRRKFNVPSHAQRSQPLPSSSNIGRELPPISEQDRLCPQAEGDPDQVVEIDEDRGRQAAVAHLRNAAEAAYFADELTREAHIETEVQARDQFDSDHADGTTDYVLLVPKAQAESAARMLLSFVKATSDDAVDPLPESMTVYLGLSKLHGPDLPRPFAKLKFVRPWSLRTRCVVPGGRGVRQAWRRR